jgi:hypothetical protein
MDYLALKNEILTDPTGIGYAPFVAVGNDSGVRDLLNEKRTGILIKRADIDPSEIFHALALADLTTNPGASTIGWMESLLTAPYSIRLLNEDGTDTPVKANIVSLLKAGTNSTRDRLLLLQTRIGSRMEQLFGAGSYVTFADIAIALRG